MNKVLKTYKLILTLQAGQVTKCKHKSYCSLRNIEKFITYHLMNLNTSKKFYHQYFTQFCNNE